MAASAFSVHDVECSLPFAVQCKLVYLHDEIQGTWKGKNRVNISDALGLLLCTVTPVGSCQVDTQTTDFGCEQKHKDVFIGVEVINKAGSEADRGGAVHAVVAVARRLHASLHDVQHLLSLCEQQGAVALLLPFLQPLQKTKITNN